MNLKGRYMPMEAEIKLLSTAEMIQVEKEADANGLTYELMMENAGLGLAEKVAEKYASFMDDGILGLVGSGNNGGDTLVALAHLAQSGWRATAYIVRERDSDDPLLERLRKSGGVIIEVREDINYQKLGTVIKENKILLDGILGTGIKLPLRGEVDKVLGFTKETLYKLDQGPVVVAVDCPSGVDCDTGETASNSLFADLTVTMAAVKRGLLDFPANDYVGELCLVSIGLENNESRSKTWQGITRRVAFPESVTKTLPPRKRDAHKGSFGTALIVAGSVNFTGAVILAGEAAYRVGTGLVTLAVPAPLHEALAGHVPEATWLLLPHEMGVIEEGATEVVLDNLEKVSAMLLGPGFGMETTTRNFLFNLFSKPPQKAKSRIGFIPAGDETKSMELQQLPPLVIDADGLKLLAKMPEWWKRIPQPTVLTPHPGEMSALTGLDVREIQAARVDVAEKFAKEWSHVVVLKGANTVIAGPDGRTTLIPVATPALARAGSGDVQAGIITGLLAQGLDAYGAAVSGSWIHAQCGLKSAELLGTNTSVMASDLINSIPLVLKDIKS